jgi:hypothetical protein
MRRFARPIAVLLAALGLHAAGCDVALEVLESDRNLADAAVADAEIDASQNPDAAQPTDAGGCVGRAATGVVCTSNADCCSGVCDIDPTAQVTCRPPTGCAPLDAPCTFAGACCTLACANGSCALGQCARFGELCQLDADCCSNDCQNGSCQGSTLTCRPAGESCTKHEECCGLLCGGEISGIAARCSLRQACRVAGEVCGADTDCCSGACGELKPGFGYCIPLAACVMADDKLCSRQVGELCKDDAECCSRVCLPSGQGNKRCAASGGCRAQCELCANDGECCSKSCLPDAAGVKRCAAVEGCLAGGEVCASDDQCCGPNGKGRCYEDPGGPTGAKRCHDGEAGAPCLGTEDTCSLGSSCCRGSCLPTSNGYACDHDCAPDGAPCTIRSDCCGLLSDCFTIAGARMCAPIVK